MLDTTTLPVVQRDQKICPIALNICQSKLNILPNTKEDHKILKDYLLIFHQSGVILSILVTLQLCVPQALSPQTKCFLNNGPSPASFLFIFGLFKLTIQF